MGIRENLQAENAAHDPHGFKSQGGNSVKSLHVNEPYIHQKFPMAVYKDKHTKHVESELELEKALAEGFSEEAPKPE